MSVTAASALLFLGAIAALALWHWRWGEPLPPKTHEDWWDEQI